MSFPKMVKVSQVFPSASLEDVAQAVKEELRRVKLGEALQPGAEIAVGASARGIKNQAVIIKTLVEELKGIGAKPFIFPAMGSHGGSTAQGQAAFLGEYNIREEFVDAPVRSSVEVDLIGTTERGIPVYTDRHACRAHGIILVNRIKAHIDFDAPHESGLYKMMVAGLGKPEGAKQFHLHASKFGHHSAMLEMARFALNRLPILFGIAIVEDGYGETETVKVLTAGEMKEGEVEAELLRRAKENMARLPFQEIDLLIVDEIGKDIAGSGLDANVIGRKGEMHTWHEQVPRIKRIIVCDLTEKTGGNALGMGHADFTTQKLVDKVDRRQTYVNAITAHVPLEGKIPIIMDDDRSAVEAALNTIGLIEPEEARVVRIKNTLELSRFEASQACLPQLEGRGNVRVEREPEGMRFDAVGNFIREP